MTISDKFLITWVIQRLLDIGFKKADFYSRIPCYDPTTWYRLCHNATTTYYATVTDLYSWHYDSPRTNKNRTTYPNASNFLAPALFISDKPRCTVMCKKEYVSRYCNVVADLYKKRFSAEFPSENPTAGAHLHAKPTRIGLSRHKTPPEDLLKLVKNLFDHNIYLEVQKAGTSSISYGCS